METIVSPVLSRGLSPEDLIKHYFFEGASWSGPTGAYNISLVSSFNLHARIAILYTFLLPIHSDVLTNSTMIMPLFADFCDLTYDSLYHY